MQRLQKTSIWLSKVSGELLLAKVKQVTTIGMQRDACLKVAVTKNNFYEYNRMFYPTSTDEWVIDPESKCREGDVVLIRRLPTQQRPSKTVAYTVEKVVFKYGNFVDPVTKRRVFGANEFKKEVELRKDLVAEIYNDPLGEGDESTESDDQTEQSKIRRKVAEKWERRNNLEEEEEDEVKLLDEQFQKHQQR